MNATRPITKAVIPVAGWGTRLLPLTKSQPKEMLPVGRKPVVQYVVEELQAAGLRQILFVTGRKKRAIEDHFDYDQELVGALQQAGSDLLLQELDYLESDASFYYVRQSEPRGLGDAVGRAADFIGDEDFVVALGDSILTASDGSLPLQEMMEAHQRLGAAAVLAVEPVDPDQVHYYGIVAPEGEPPEEGAFPLRDLVEKPRRETTPSNLAIAARYVFSPAIFDAISRTLPDRQGQLQLTDAARLLVQSGQPVYGWRLRRGQRRYDIGNFESYFKAFIDFALVDERYGYLARQYLKAKAYEI
ncbi:MAG TPA: UTP--glucose-1-phosphate uridylyltransferase [Anaerolineae bacterium]|nr:UTP--glucose-1-phosphate uridylyltransferase [Anaerolineae bacterium]HIQ05430.1 UTP--glucose-1-phosphate uridylyltransferase [Anaerolineae bacterium]